MAIDARNRTLPDWFTRIRTRQIVLPRFQRFEAWDHSTVTQLFNTILRDLPIGALLVLEIGNEEPFVSRTLRGAPATGERVTEHLLDGQQRLTGLWRGLNNNYDERTYFLYMESDEETGMPFYVGSIARWQKEGDKERRPFWANRAEGQWERGMVPLELCAPGEDGVRRFREWAKAAIPDDSDAREKLTETIWGIRAKLAAFNLPYLSLPVATPKDTALDVFIKMNTSAAPLTIYDIVVAQVEAGMGKSLHDLISDTREKCPTIADYYSLEDLTLYAGALMQGMAPTNGTYMSKGFGERLLANWDSFLLGASRAATFLEEERVFEWERLPTDVVIPVLVALWAVAPRGLDGEGRARNVLRKYLWRAFFSNRYEKSTGSRSLADCSELRPLITGEGSSKPSIFDDAQHPLPQPQELIQAGWPKNKDRLARGVMALSLRSGGLDLADGGTITRQNLAKREYHHLFPDAHLQRTGVDDEMIYLALNCALVTWRTNRNISDKGPERYLAERREGTSLGEPEIRARLASHLIPYDEMVTGNYPAFLAARANLVHAAMLKLCADGASGGGA